MKKAILISGILSALFFASCSSSSSEYDKVIQIQKKNIIKTNNSTFEGWGTSLCWWANRLGYDDVLAEKSAQSFFGDNGLQLNIMRYNVGGGDNPNHNHITRTDSNMPGLYEYNKAENSYTLNPNKDFNQLNVLKRAYKASGKNGIVEVFSNSPPFFMTESGCSTGNIDANKNNLKESEYENFAEYFVSCAAYIQNELNIPVASLDPMNEPNTNYWGANSWKQEGCHFDAGESQSRIIEATYNAIQKHGLKNSIISASDETDTGKALDSYKAYSDSARSKIGRINAHTYGTDRIEELGKFVEKNKLNLWMSEVDDGITSGRNAGEMGAGIYLAKKIISDFNALNPSAWVLWQVIDTHTSSAGYNGRIDTGAINTRKGYWGIASANHDTKELQLTQKYYTFGQFSRYIKPGSSIIKCGDKAIASWNKNKNGKTELVVVAVNDRDEKQQWYFSAPDFIKGECKVDVIRTSGGLNDGESWKLVDKINYEKKGFTCELSENSVTTFIIK